MKKTIFLFMSILIFNSIIGSFSDKVLLIPDESIRLRVIANSNSEYDQSVKKIVKNEVQDYMSSILQNVDNIGVSRTVISNNLSDLNEKISQTLADEKYSLPFNVNFGLNYFPDKIYKGIKYKEGLYESLVVTLGSGDGDNWWCVLFPPLCLLEAEESNEVEYTSIVKEILNKYV